MSGLAKNRTEVTIARNGWIFEQVTLHERLARPIRVKVDLPLVGVPFEQVESVFARLDVAQFQSVAAPDASLVCGRGECEVSTGSGVGYLRQSPSRTKIAEPRPR